MPLCLISDNETFSNENWTVAKELGILGECILGAFLKETQEMRINPNLQMKAIESDPEACSILEHEGIL